MRNTPAGTRARLIATLAALAVMSTMTAAVAQDSVDLNLDIENGTRVITVSDVAGQPLTDLDMTPGQPETYKVTVTDTNYAVDEVFQVAAENGNLYAEDGVDGYDFATMIESDDVSITTSPGANSGLSIDLTPTLLLNGDAATCAADLAAILPLAVVRTLVCSAASSTLGSITDLPIQGDTIDAGDLTGDLINFINLTLGTGGTFDEPSYIGIGAADPDAAGAVSPSTQMVLQGGFDGLTDAALDPILAAIVNLGGAADVTSVIPATDIIAALSGQAGGVLASTLGTLTPSQQDGVINALFSLTLDNLGIADLSSLTGSYTAFPSLVVQPDAGTAAGSYSGTHTVTIVSP